jgi:uncharacterized cupin superfamily protein
MVDEARLEEVGSGLAPVSPGWFVVNVGEAAWLRNDSFGGRCVFETTERVLQERPGVAAQHFDQIGYTLAVLEPGKPTGMYHAESSQEGFLVLAGECLLLIEEHERPLHAWDFVHCPPNTKHVIVGAGSGPCLVIAIGSREQSEKPDGLGFPVDEVAKRYGASVEEDTMDGGVAYAHVAPREPTAYRDGWLPE